MPSPFEAAFERHVWPVLAERAHVNGTLVALGLMEWGTATDELATTAQSRGANHLGDDGRWYDKLIAMLLDEINDAEEQQGAIAAFAVAEPSKLWRWVWRT